MGRLRAASLFLAALAACLLLAACGSSGNGELLPGTTADQITSNLDLVRESAAEGDCEEAEVAVAQISEEVDGLQGVDKKLKSNLEEGATKLSEVVNSCSAEAEAEEQKENEEAQAEEEVQREEDEELQAEEEAKSQEQEQKREEREEKAQEREKAEEEAEQPGPTEEGEESGSKGKGPGKQEEIEPPSEEVIPPVEEGPAGGIGPGAEAGGGG